MLRYFGLDTFRPPWQEATVCIGVFDGVHLGHRAIVREAVERARMAGRPAVALTFDRHPMTVLAPERAPKAISSVSANLDRLASLGLDVAVVATFDGAFSKVSAEEFYESALVEKLRSVEFVVGHDFAFGHRREGTAAWLESRAPTHVHPPLEIDGRRISSTAIRGAIEAGDVASAARLLGAPYALEGVVVRGLRLGTQLGVPTANLSPPADRVLPGLGIYAGRATLDGATYAAAISVGERPSVDEAGFAIEAHFADYVGGDLYGRAMEIEFLDRLRDEERFESHEELSRQMREDIDIAKKLVRAHG